MSLRVIWQYMDRSIYCHSFGPYNIFLVMDRSIYCHMILSAMNYLLYKILSIAIKSILVYNKQVHNIIKT